MQGGAYLEGSHSLKGAEEGKAGLLSAPWPRMAFCGPGKEQKGPVRGEGKFEGEGGLSAPPSPSRQKWLQRGLPGSLEGAAQGSLAPRKAFLPGKRQTEVSIP